MILLCFFDNVLKVTTGFKDNTIPMQLPRGYYHICIQGSLAVDAFATWYCELDSFKAQLIIGLKSKKLLIINECDEDSKLTHSCIRKLPPPPKYIQKEVLGYPTSHGSTIRPFEQVTTYHTLELKYGYDEDDWNTKSEVFPLKYTGMKLVVNDALNIDMIHVGSTPYKSKTEIPPGVYEVWQIRNPYNPKHPPLLVIYVKNRKSLPDAIVGRVPSGFHRITENPNASLATNTATDDESEKKQLLLALAS